MTRSAGEILSQAKCILLDFDGPVCSVFSGWPAPEVANHVRKAVLADQLPLGEVGLHTDDPLEVLRDAAAHSPDGQRRAEAVLSAAEVICVESARETPGVRALLQTAYAASVPVIIVSNNGDAAIQAFLAAHDLAELVSGVVARDPTHASRMKPNPHPVLEALSMAKRGPAEAVMVGDTASDVIAANDAGVTTIGFANKPAKARVLTQAGAEAVTSQLPPEGFSSEGTPTR